MSASDKLTKFIVNYLKIKIGIRTPDLKLLRKLCKDTPPQHIYTIIKECTRHNIRHELKDTPDSLLKDYENDDRTCLHVAAKDENFEMIDTLFEKLSDKKKLQLLRLRATDDVPSCTVGLLCIRNGGVSWAMELAKSATHEDLKREIYEKVLVYTCQNDDAPALQHLLSAVSSDTLMSLLSRLILGGFNCIQAAAQRGINSFISLILQHFHSDSVLPILLEQREGDGGKTVLHFACGRNKLNVVKTIIDLVPIEKRFRLIIATDDNENTVLHAAVASGDENLVLALKMDQLTGEQQYALMVKENKDGLRARDLAKEQKNKQLEGFFDNRLQQSSIRKCDE